MSISKILNSSFIVALYSIGNSSSLGTSLEEKVRDMMLAASNVGVMKS